MVYHSSESPQKWHGSGSNKVGFREWYFPLGHRHLIYWYSFLPDSSIVDPTKIKTLQPDHVLSLISMFFFQRNQSFWHGPWDTHIRCFRSGSGRNTATHCEAKDIRPSKFPQAFTPGTLIGSLPDHVICCSNVFGFWVLTLEKKRGGRGSRQYIKMFNNRNYFFSQARKRTKKMLDIEVSEGLSRLAISKLTVTQLIEELNFRELDTSGKKPTLVKRLNKYLKGML